MKEILMEGKAKGRRTGVIGKAHAVCVGFGLWRLESVMHRVKIIVQTQSTGEI
jgi:hypothetical protein